MSEYLLEKAATDVQRGDDSLEHLMDVFVSEMVFVPSSSDPTSGVTPVMTMADGATYLVVGASPRSLRGIGSLMRFVVTLTGRQVLGGLNEDVGVMVMLESGAFGIDADLAREARAKHGISRSASP